MNCFKTKNVINMINKSLTGSNAAAAVVAGVCGCRWLWFLAILRDLYDWFEIGVFAEWFNYQMQQRLNNKLTIFTFYIIIKISKIIIL